MSGKRNERRPVRSLRIAGASIEAPGGSQSISQLTEQLRAEQRAYAELAINAPREPVKLHASRNLRFPAVGPFQYLTYTVPDGLIIALTHVGLSLSRTWVWACDWFGWKIARDRMSIALIQTVDPAFTNEWILDPFGSARRPEEIFPVYFSANQTISFEGLTFSEFENYCRLEVCLQGFSFSPAQPVGVS